jgi:transcriptional regulator with XRE-family HTH domain
VDDFLAKLSQNISAAREAAGLTQDEAAAAAGMQPAQYSRVERGEVDARLSTLLRIAQGLGVDIVVLLDGVQPVN